MFLFYDKNVLQDTFQAVLPQGFGLGNPLLVARDGVELAKTPVRIVAIRTGVPASTCSLGEQDSLRVPVHGDFDAIHRADCLMHWAALSYAKDGRFPTIQIRVRQMD